MGSIARACVVGARDVRVIVSVAPLHLAEHTVPGLRSVFEKFPRQSDDRGGLELPRRAAVACGGHVAGPKNALACG